MTQICFLWLEAQRRLRGDGCACAGKRGQRRALRRCLMDESKEMDEIKEVEAKVALYEN